MSATQDAMTAAVTAAEAATVALAQALSDYQTAYRSAAQTVYNAASDDRRGQDKNDLEHALGPERPVMAVAQRLRALGAVRVLEQSPGLGVTDAGWTTKLIAQITAHVP